MGRVSCFRSLARPVLRRRFGPTIGLVLHVRGAYGPSSGADIPESRTWGSVAAKVGFSPDGRRLRSPGSFPKMTQLSATRSELLARRAQIALATQGRDLLKDKRAALIREFGRLSASVLEAVEALGRHAAESERALGDALSFDGPEAVGSAALAAAGDIGTRLSPRSIAGVHVVELEHEPAARAVTARCYSIAASTALIDAAASSFERQLDLLLDVAATELSLRRLAAEITQTTRRVNALEHVVVPRLERERKAIRAVLDERELEDRIRLRRARTAARRGHVASEVAA